MISDDKSRIKEERAIDALIHLAFSIADERIEVTEKEIAAFEQAQKEPSKETVARVESCVASVKQRIAEEKLPQANGQPFDLRGILERLKRQNQSSPTEEAGQQKIIDAIRLFKTKTEFGLAAAHVNYARDLACTLYCVTGTDTTFVLSECENPEYIGISVRSDSAGILEGAEIVRKDSGAILERIVKGSCAFKAPHCESIVIRTSGGNQCTFIEIDSIE